MVAFARSIFLTCLPPNATTLFNLLEAAFSGRCTLDGELILPHPAMKAKANSSTPQQFGNLSALQTNEEIEDEEGSEASDVFSLFDWTVAFRHSARLASEHSSSANYSLTLTLTPGVLVEPAPYSLGGGFGSEGLFRYDRWQVHPVADYQQGQLLLEASTASPTTINPSGEHDASVLNRTRPLELAGSMPQEMVVTTAPWLVRRPSQGIVSMSRDLIEYLRQVIIQERKRRRQPMSPDDTMVDHPFVREQVDFAISLSATVAIDSLSTPATTTTPNITNASSSSENKYSDSFVQKTARVKAYAPSFFADLRRSFGIEESSYWKSLIDDSLPFVSFQSNSKGARRVGGLFFFSREGSYMIKTLKADEARALLGNILSKYRPYMNKYGKISLLSRLCGLYQVQMYATKCVNGTKTKVKSRVHTFLVLNSVFPAYVSKSIAERFDLKGSTLGRLRSSDEVERDGPSAAVLKDLDLANEVEKMRSAQRLPGRQRIVSIDSKSLDNTCQSREGLHLGPASKAAIFAQLRKDVELLVECNIIDYSLLVGIHLRQSPMFNFLTSVLSQQAAREWMSESLTPTNRLATGPHNTRLMFGYSLGWKANQYTPVLQMQQCAIMSYDDVWERCNVNCGPLTKLFGERLGTPCVYYLGLIDFLQTFNQKKDAEYRWKTLKYGQKAGFSCIPPVPYAKRFLAFLDRHIT